MTSRARRLGGHAAALALALVFVAFTFVYRFNALGGTLGGLDDDHFPVLARADLIARGELPLRDFADAELRGAWPALSYQVPAWVQQAWGRNFLSEAYFTVGVLALCAGIVFLTARSLSGRWPIAAMAAAVVVVSGAELYNFPKVLALTVAVPLLVWLLARRSLTATIVLAGWTAVAGLFRHDYAVYIAAAAIVGLAIRNGMTRGTAGRSVAAYLAAMAVWLLPSAVWVQYYTGIPRYISSSLAASRTESATRSLGDWPSIDVQWPFADATLVACLYYVFWAVPVVALVLLVGRSRGPGRWDSVTVATGAALVTLTFVVNHYFLRSSLESRFGDAVVPVVLLAAWVAGRAPAVPARTARALSWLAPSAVMVLMAAMFVQTNALARELRTAGLVPEPAAAAARFREVQRQLRRLPPNEWTGADATGSLVVARYLAECTSRDDRVLVGAYASEIPVYADRGFAAGQGTFALGFYRSEEDQRRAVEQLRRQSVPVAIVRAGNEEFARNYPLVWQHVATRFRDAGTVDIGGEPYFHVYVDALRAPRRTHPASGLPCFT